jgi:hypothetical protein
MTEARSFYPARLVSRAAPTEEGISFWDGGELRHIPWSRVRRVAAAEVGEPEGVRTVVFDLLAHEGELGYAVYRFDADPMDVLGVARAVESGIGKERAVLALRSLAADGVATASFPDLGSFEEAAAAALGGV